MDWINGEEKFQNVGVEKVTHKKYPLTISFRMKFCKLCGISDYGMETLYSVQNFQIICGFMHTVRSGKLTKQQGICVAGGTAKLVLNNVAAAILESGRKNPAKDYEGDT